MSTDINIINDSSRYTMDQAVNFSRKNAGQIALRVDSSGGVCKSFANYCTILEKDPYLSGKIRLNLLSGRAMIKDVYWAPQEHVLRDTDLSNLRRFTDSVYEISGGRDLRDAVGLIAEKNAFHPIRDELVKLVWDGHPRLGELLPRYLGAERSVLTTEITKLMLHGAIKRVMEPGIKFDSCIIFADSKQGTGKSSLCRFLALKDEFFCDDLYDLGNTKNAFETIRGHWICELGEMIATRRTKDVNLIKGYISRQNDSYRQPFGIFSEGFPRQTIFIGTSNQPHCLPKDRTGNRRFVPVLCDGDKADVHPLADEAETREYIRQCYAEAMVIGESKGYRLDLDQEYHTELDAIRYGLTLDDNNIGIIQNFLDTCEEDIVCSRMIWEKAFQHSEDASPDEKELSRIAEVMNSSIRGWERYAGLSGTAKDSKYRFPYYGKQRAWQRCA